MYSPIVARLEDVQSIPGADRVVSATASGYRLVVGADHKAGELGVVFPSEGVLDTTFALHAGLLREHPTSGAKLDGYLDPVPRVRCLTIRGVRTEALWIPIATFAAALSALLRSTPSSSILITPSQFREGSEVGTFGDLVIARKYVAPPLQTPRTKKVRDASPENRRMRDSRAAVQTAFPQHYDTSRAQHGVHAFPVSAYVYATEKLHGTSGRTGRVALRPLSRLRRAVNRFAGLFGRRPFDPHTVITGTRRTAAVLQTDARRPDMRADISAWIAPRLRPGEVVYYEIVGYYSTGKAIQVQHPATRGAESAALKKRWGDEIRYSYGCDPGGDPIVPERPYPGTTQRDVGTMGLAPARRPMHRVFVYRVTRDGVDLAFEDLRRRAIEIGLEVPPMLGAWHHVPPATFRQGVAATSDEQVAAARRAACAETLRQARALAEGDRGTVPSTLDPTHPCEGVVLRVDPRPATGAGHVACKFKAHGFGVLEGYSRDRGEVDVEDEPGDDNDLAVTAALADDAA